MGEINCQFIMETISGWIQDKKQISPELWIESAEKLNILESYEHDKLVDLERQFNALITNLAEQQDKQNLTAAEKKAKGSSLYVDYRKQELFIKRIDQAIALAKKHASLTSYAH